MIPDRELVEQAKAKLGEQTFFVMMDTLGIEDYDSRNLKCRCPFHDEETPSFIFNKKTNQAHCFGTCGRSWDIIDVFISTGMTYVEAVQKLFELTDTNFAFGEHHIQTKHQYKYPHEEPLGDKSAVYRYLSLRGISQKTADYLDIRQDPHGNLVFNYYDENDVLTMVKYRPSRKIAKGEVKNWCQKDADTFPLLYNMNRVNVSEPLVICEGELDCAALVEAGITNAVSIPLGSQNQHWIEHNWDWLEQFDSVVLCGDNDDPGRKMIKEITPRLGSWRVKIVDLPAEYTFPSNGKTISVKDANEVLYLFGKETLRNAVLNAKETMVPSVIDFADVEDVNLNEIDGIQFGIKELDESLLKLFYGTFNVISGKPASGKTSFLYQLIANSMEDGVNCWVYSREMSAWLSKNWFNHIIAGPQNIVKGIDAKSGADYYYVPDNIKRQIADAYRGQLMLYRDDYPNDMDSVLKAMVDSRCKYGCRVFLIDNLMTVDLGGNDENTNERQTKFANELIHFATKYNACVILVAHPRKMMDQEADVGIYDVLGTSNLMNLAIRALSLRRVTAAEKAGVPNRKGDGWEKEPNPYDVIIHVIKDRYRGKTGITVGTHYDIPSRRFFTNKEEYGKRYSWDKAEHPPLRYPIEDPAEEIFGAPAQVTPPADQDASQTPRQPKIQGSAQKYFQPRASATANTQQSARSAGSPRGSPSPRGTPYGTPSRQNQFKSQIRGPTPILQ